jgi:predicted double-glycine peptidase
MLRFLALLLVLSVAPLAFPVYAATVPFAVLPGGALTYKPIVSMRERRFLNLVEQKTDFSCGAAAMASILNEAYGLNLNEEAVIQGMLAEADSELVRSQGFSMLDMKRYATTLGFRARGYRLEAKTLESIKVPTIVLINSRGYKHFVVLLRSADGWVYVGDPVLGHNKISLNEFEKSWNGIVFAVIGSSYNRNNALLRPPEPLTAKHRLNSFSPVNDAELMEFGFIQSDFF